MSPIQIYSFPATDTPSGGVYRPILDDGRAVFDSSSPTISAFNSGWTPDEFTNNTRFQELHSELRSLLVTGANSTSATREHTPTADQAISSQYLSNSIRRPNLIECLSNGSDRITLATKIEYLRIWTLECAPWLDMFDQSRNFGLVAPVIARESQAVLNALLAVAARQKERMTNMKGGSYDSIEFYSRSISALTTSFRGRDTDVLTAACLLCVLEMMSANPRDWRRHLDGCAAVFQASGVNGFSGGFLQAVFWCYARMDLIEALLADQTESTVLPLERWAILPGHSPGTFGPAQGRPAVSEYFLQHGMIVPDMHANYAVYLCASVCDMLCRRTRYLEMGDDNGCDSDHFNQSWTSLWSELQTWHRRRPAEMQPAQYTDGTPETHMFPQLFFPHWAAISSNQLFHTACILLLNSKPATLTSSQITLEYSQNPQHASPIWHARQVVGISATNPHPGCLNNAIQPLYIAGRLFSHPNEQGVVVKLLNHIEACSGWASKWRISDLEVDWGCPSGTYSRARAPT